MEFVEKFRAALRIPSFWPAGDALQTEMGREAVEAAEAPLLRFHDFLAGNFPAFNKAAERYVLSPYSVAYRWPCRRQSGPSNKRAVLFLAHYDVVPVETGGWASDPFGAEVKDGFIYGRGSLDMKSVLVSIMEAAENLCAGQWRPERDVWFAFGGDEERTGVLGALETAKWFEKQGQTFEWILDEGTPVAENQITGIDTPLALVSIEEKGYLSLNLSAAQEPGHASKPPRIQAAAVLAKALCRIAKNPFPYKLTPAVETFFKEASRFAPGMRGFAMRRARALGPLFFKLAARNPAMEAMLKTTVAMTRLEGSPADNVLPSEVNAVINLRLLPPWNAETAAAFITKTIRDKRVKVSVYGLGTDPVPAGEDSRREGWTLLKTAVEKAWPGVPLLPFIMTATTDSRHYRNISGCIYRFNPHKLGMKELGGIHGRDERISLENLRKGLEFYTELLRLL